MWNVAALGAPRDGKGGGGGGSRIGTLLSGLLVHSTQLFFVLFGEKRKIVATFPTLFPPFS